MHNIVIRQHNVASLVFYQYSNISNTTESFLHLQYYNAYI